MSANIVIYFNDDILQNTSKGVTFICKKPAYFFIPYTMSLADLESGLCRCIEAETPKTVEKITYRCPISIFGGFMQYQAIPISDDGDLQQMFRIHQQHQIQIPTVELYVNFKEAAVDLYNQADDEEEEEEAEPGTIPEREIEWEQNIGESDDEDFEGQYGSGDDSADDEIDEDANDGQLHISNRIVASQHPFGEPSFMRALDLEAMHAPEFPEYVNLSL